MTREEAKEKLYMEWQGFLEDNVDYAGISDAYQMAIEALEQQPCEDCISREAVLDLCDSKDPEYKVRHFKEDVECLPPVTPRQKTGQWISMNTGKRVHLKDGMSTESVKCSECDEWLTASDEYACNGNYCPNCGAKMEVK